MIDLKECTGCKKKLDLKLFRLDNRKRNGHGSRCIFCEAHSKRNVKIRVFSHYCNDIPHCQCPNCDAKYIDVDFLTIDHINGNGKEHRRRIGTGSAVLYYWLIRNNFPPGFQVLCFNCNQAKAWNRGICPHNGRHWYE